MTRAASPPTTTGFHPSTNIAELRESATIAVSVRAKALRAAGRMIIDLGAGEPDQPTPAYVMKAAHLALEAGATRYTMIEGIPPLREKIAARASALHLQRIAANQVVVSAGTKQALFNACFSVFGAGDEVLVPTPAWTSYYEILSLARANAIVVRGSAARSLKVDVDDLLRRATERTRGLVVNSPCNPTGAIYTDDELRAIAELADERGWWIISDEIYRPITYDVTASSMLSIASSMERLIVVDGVAKGFAMPGWRIGWSISSVQAARAMTALQSHVTSNATTISQHAALAALSNPAAEAEARQGIIEDYRHRRDAAIEQLRAARVAFVQPEGAFYLFIRVGDGAAFANLLLEQRDVAVVPGTAFHAPEWIRVSYAAPDQDVANGIAAIIDQLRSPS
jgi:aspartate aminotransferase